MSNAVPCADGQPSASAQGMHAHVPCVAASCRQMFVNHRLAKIAAEKAFQEAQARINVQQQLSAAQAQATQRALVVAREKAANEAKSEFMSLMCHEVRTPLNGCLASAEMLLEMPLQVNVLQCAFMLEDSWCDKFQACKPVLLAPLSFAYHTSLSALHKSFCHLV